jgi:capsular polysaccharide transport system permease protein
MSDIKSTAVSEVGGRSVRERGQNLPEPPGLRGASRLALFDDTAELPPLPEDVGRPPIGLIVSFVVCVIVPAMLAAIYYFFIASSQYQSEFRFSIEAGTPAVPGSSPNSASQSMSSAMGQVGGMMAQSLSNLMSTGGGGSMNASAQNYVVVDYLKSRQAADELQKRIDARALYSRPAIDGLARFNNHRPQEYFARYWNKMVSAEFDPMTGLAVVKVKAFTPQDAHLIAQTLVGMSDDIINDVANKPYEDAVKSAKDQVNEEQAQLSAIQKEMGQFRNASGNIDPTQGAVPTNVQEISTAQGNLLTLQAQLDALKRLGQGDSARAVTLQAAIQSQQRWLAAIQAQVAKPADGRGSLSNVVGRFEDLTFQRQNLENLLAASMQTLAQTQAYELQRKLYLVPYASPNLPVAALYPQRLLSVVTITIIAFGIWLFGALLVKAVRQHMV